jgi:uncharacterized protein (DUF433 family)
MLGHGVYSLPEAARYTQTNVARLRTWFRPRSDTSIGPVFRGDYHPVGGDFAISFLDLIEAKVASQLREWGVSMHTIRQAQVALSKQLSVAHPFAHSDLYTDGRRVFIDVAEQIDDHTLSEVVSGQQFFPGIRRFLTQIDYGSDSGLAVRWRIAPGVEMAPGVRFGKPVVRGTGVATYVVSAAYIANAERRSLVADLFDLTEKQVADAVDFETRLAESRAA